MRSLQPLNKPAAVQLSAELDGHLLRFAHRERELAKAGAFATALVWLFVVPMVVRRGPTVGAACAPARAVSLCRRGYSAVERCVHCVTRGARRTVPCPAAWPLAPKLLNIERCAGGLE